MSCEITIKSVPLGPFTKVPGFAKLGDSIETTVGQPAPGVIKMALMTPESYAAGNELLLNKNSGWSLSVPEQ